MYDRLDCTLNFHNRHNSLNHRCYLPARKIKVRVCATSFAVRRAIFQNEIEQVRLYGLLRSSDLKRNWHQRKSRDRALKVCYVRRWCNAQFCEARSPDRDSRCAIARHNPARRVIGNRIAWLFGACDFFSDISMRYVYFFRIFFFVLLVIGSSSDASTHSLVCGSR